MELQGAPGKPLIPKLTLEDYLNLEHLDVIAPAILRKIIMMHGFNSYKVQKDDLLDAVRSINLMDAHHSTLLSDISSNAFLGLNDVIRDLSFLHWQECCISSIKTINSVTSFSSGVDESSPKSFKQNYNTASSSQEDFEDHETQSRALKKIKENASVTYYGEQVGQMNRPKARYGEQVEQVNRPKARYRERADQVNRPNVHDREQADPVKKPKRGIKKPISMKEYM